jgi:hypothetical protein
MDCYKKIVRPYFDPWSEEWKKGTFLAGGLQADGHLAYDRLDEEGNVIEGEETSWYQARYEGKLVMFHI